MTNREQTGEREESDEIMTEKIGWKKGNSQELIEQD